VLFAHAGVISDTYPPWLAERPMSWVPGWLCWSMKPLSGCPLIGSPACSSVGFSGLVSAEDWWAGWRLIGIAAPLACLRLSWALAGRQSVGEEGAAAAAVAL